MTQEPPDRRRPRRRRFAADRLAVVAVVAGIAAALFGMATSLSDVWDDRGPHANPDFRPTASPTPPAATGVPIPPTTPPPVQRIEIVVIPGQADSRAADGSGDGVSQVALLTTSIGTLLTGVGALGALAAALRRRQDDEPSPTEPSS